MLKQVACHYLAIIIALYFSCYAPPALAQKYASIIIDDLGNNLDRGKSIIQLPAAVTLAILPKTKHAKTLATLAFENNKEIMLHLPLQSIENHNHSPGTLNLHMTHEEFLSELASNIKSVPHIKGINNHMGSLLTMHPGHMKWLMKEISTIGSLFFVDSRTSSKTVAGTIAIENNVPSVTRDIFLDPDFKPETITKQFEKFLETIHQQGHAIAIAHPHPLTLQFIKEHLPVLEEQGIELVSVSQLIKLQTGEGYVTCTGATCAGF